ncbi:MAG: ribosome maturation factor RimP [Peptococcaceae bacterium]|nr:ribosome maturation factor RimP [Peptococcaceae bacterium]
MAEKMIDKIAEKALPIIRDTGYEMADIELVKEGSNWYLRFFIEHPNPDEPITTDDCGKVSERLSDWLDKEDPIPYAYFLEVSSPGIERPLKTDKDFSRFQGCMVQVMTFAPVDGKKMHIGSLGLVTEKEFVLQQDERDIVFAREKISGVRLYWDEEDLE